MNEKLLKPNWTGGGKSKDLVHTPSPKGYTEDERNVLDKKAFWPIFRKKNRKVLQTAGDYVTE